MKVSMNTFIRVNPNFILTFASNSALNIYSNGQYILDREVTVNQRNNTKYLRAASYAAVPTELFFPLLGISFIYVTQNSSNNEWARCLHRASHQLAVRGEKGKGPSEVKVKGIHRG